MKYLRYAICLRNLGPLLTYNITKELKWFKITGTSARNPFLATKKNQNRSIENIHTSIRKVGLKHPLLEVDRRIMQLFQKPIGTMHSENWNGPTNWCSFPLFPKFLWSEYNRSKKSVLQCFMEFLLSLMFKWFLTHQFCCIQCVLAIRPVSKALVSAAQLSGAQKLRD